MCDTYLPHSFIFVTHICLTHCYVWHIDTYSPHCAVLAYSACRETCPYATWLVGTCVLAALALPNVRVQSLIHKCDMTHSCVLAWMTHSCVLAWMTHSCVLWSFAECNHSFTSVTCLIHVNWHEWLIHVYCDLLRSAITHSQVWHDSFICVYSVAKTRKMPYLYRSFPQKSHVISGSFAQKDLQLKASDAFLPPCRLHWPRSGCVSLFFRMRDMTHWYVCTVCAIHVYSLIYVYCQCANVWHDSFVCVLSVC